MRSIVTLLLALLTAVPATADSLQQALADLTRDMVPDRWTPAVAASDLAVADAPQIASTLRLDVRRIQVQLNRGAWLDHTRAPLVEIAIERFRWGPPRALIVARQGPWLARSVRPGAEIRIALIDGREQDHELFRGILVGVTLSRDRQELVTLTAVRPTLTDRGRGLRTFTDMKASDIVQLVADERGLQAEVSSTQPTRWVEQRGDAWPFLTDLAAQNGYAISTSGDLLRFLPNTEPVPTPAPRRTQTWLAMRDSEIAQAIADARGMQVQVDASEETHSRVEQDETDDRFLHSRATHNGFGYYRTGDRLFFVNDGSLSENPHRRSQARRSAATSALARPIAEGCRKTLIMPRVDRAVPRQTQRDETDVEFLYRMAREGRYDVASEPDAIRFSDSASGGRGVDLLAHRLRIRFDQRSNGFATLHPSPCQQLVSPLAIPTTEHQLLLMGKGKAARASFSPPARLAPLAATLERALAASERTLAARGGPPELRFLVERARSHRGSIVHRFAIMADGPAQLDAIARHLEELAAPPRRPQPPGSSPSR